MGKFKSNSHSEPWAYRLSEGQIETQRNELAKTLNHTIFERDGHNKGRNDKLALISNKLINNRMELKTIDLLDQINETGIISKQKKQQIEEFVSRGLNSKKKMKNTFVPENIENQMIIDVLPGTYTGKRK